ncbi:unnamed protein product [Camellia sinensis]
MLNATVEAEEKVPEDVKEKDGFNAKVQTLIADMNSRDNQIKLLEEQHVELIAGSKNGRELVDALRMRVGELEKEVDMQFFIFILRVCEDFYTLL